MVPDKYSLASVGRYLIDAFERRRPALRAWTSQVEATPRADSEQELEQMERQLKELEIDDPKHWERVRAIVEDVLIPRYAKLASDEIALANREYGIWRGGDLVARGTFALAGFLLGIIAVESPYIPVYEKWFPGLLLIAGPMFPDIALWWYRRRYQKKLNGLVGELAKANLSLDTYRPISELQRSLGQTAAGPMRADLAEAPPLVERDPDAKKKAPGERDQND